MTPEERDLVQELAECQGQVNDSEYNDAQKAILNSLAKRGLVALRWVITEKGEDAITKPGT